MVRAVNWKYSGPMPRRRHCRSRVGEIPYSLATVVGEMRAKTVPFACPMPRSFRHACRNLSGEGIGQSESVGPWNTGAERGYAAKAGCGDLPRKDRAVASTSRNGTTQSLQQGRRAASSRAVPDNRPEPKPGVGDLPEQAMRLCAITCVSIHGLRALIGDTGVSARKSPGRCAGHGGGDRDD